jgi:L-fuconolactonase
MVQLSPHDFCIDAHHHLWRYHPPGPPWMSEELNLLRRDFDLEDLREVAAESGITGTVVVEVERTASETRWLTSIAEKDSWIKGVVGWIDLTAPTIHDHLEELAELPKVKGVRHPIHDEPDPHFVLREDFNRGIDKLRHKNLTFDLLIYEDHLPQTITFVDRHPNQIFVLDHIAKPRIREGSFHAWREHMMELGRRDNVYCKLSGMVTESSWTSWTAEQLLPYIETALESFGPQRLMFGSDWPVVTLASTYSRWISIIRSAIASLTQDEHDWILWRSATRAYGLK